MENLNFDFILSDYDIYLFNQGRHFDIYKKLGSHHSVNRDRQGVHFALWAPNAFSVAVVGDFNSWSKDSSKMIKREECGCWEIFIPNISEGKYKYFLIAENGEELYKSDPYAYFAELRPESASIIYKHNYIWNDDDYIVNRDKKHFNKEPVSIYELHAGSWMRRDDGSFYTYRELADYLPKYVEECGFTHVEFMPLMEHPFDGSWGYQVTGYYAPTSRYGTPYDLKYLIESLHSKNIGVILDWVPAHFPSDAFGLHRFDGTSLYEYEDPRKGFHPEWNTYIFDYGKNQVRNFLVANALYWFEYYHIDGLRVDAVASMLYLDYARQEWVPNIHGGNENLEAVHFLQELNKEVYLRNKGVMVIAEESTSWPGVTKPADKEGLGFGFKWNMGWMNDFLEYMSQDPLYRKHCHNKLTFSMTYAFSENYILPLSHDEVVHCKNSLLGKMPGSDEMKFSGLKAALTHMYAHPGKKLVFMGGEIAQWKEWNHDVSIDWNLLENKNNSSYYKYFKDLNHFYKNHPALYVNDSDWTGFEWLICDDSNNSVIAYLRRGRSEKETLLIVINFTPVQREGYKVSVPFDCFWKEVLNSNASIYGGTDSGNKGGFHSVCSSLMLTLPPMSAIIMEPEF